MNHMTEAEFHRAISMWGLAICILAAAAGWVFMRFGQAWSIADLPTSDYVAQIVPAYVVTEVALIPVGGKLVDRYGVRAVLGIAPFIYIIGSLLCVVSVSVVMLIMFRLVQGAGAGLMLALGFSAVGKFYEGANRGKCNELMTAAFAVGSLFGTALGFFLTDNFNWRAGFVVLSLLMMIGTVMAAHFLPEEEGRVSVPFNSFGLFSVSLLFAIGTLYTQMVNNNFELVSTTSMLFAVTIIVLTILLFHRSRRAKYPAVPVHASWFERIMFVLMFMFSLCGLGLITYYFKLYLTFYEFDIYRASVMFLVMLAGAAGPSIIGSRKVYQTGARPWIVVGSVLTACGLMLTHFIADEGVPQLAISLFAFGLGLGCIVTQIICSLQTVVPREHMGLHIGNLMAIRMVGILVGNAIIGSYINNVINRDRGENVIDLSTGEDLMTALTQHISAGIAYVADALADGFLSSAFILAVMAALLTLLALKLGKDDLEEH